MVIHIVARNETLMRIAAKHGFLDYRTIYEHPDNAEFRCLRPNPQVLKEGDEICIPEVTSPKSFQCETGRTHTFVVQAPPVHELRIYARDNGQPLACKDYVLEVDGQKLRGRTDRDGLVKKPVPPRAKRAVLRFPSAGLEWALQIGALDPLRDPDGIRQRLANLGYVGEGDGVSEETLHAQLMRFQRAHGLKATGHADAATIAKLKEAHDRGMES